MKKKKKKKKKIEKKYKIKKSPRQTTNTLLAKGDTIQRRSIP